MRTHTILPGLFLYLVAVFAIAQDAVDSQLPLTEHGHPDLQGTWSVASLTPLERPDYFEDLTTTPAEAEKYIAEFREFVEGEGLEDPDFALQNVQNFDVINGELRTSVITIPENGRIPYSEKGGSVAANELNLFLNAYDHPEQRPLMERCLGGLSIPPMRPFIVDIPRKIVQNEDYLMLYSEDPAGARIIPLNGKAPKNTAPSFAGTSFGYWMGETLIIETSNFRNDYPGRITFGPMVVLSENSSVIERFTRVSDERLLYQFTMTDPVLYTQAWSGEFTLQASPHETYEYGCHEGNYSLPGILMGGRMEQERMAAEELSAQ